MKSRPLHLAAVILPLLLAASCAPDPTGPGPSALRLSAAERKWRNAALRSYSFKSTVSCFCVDTYVRPMLVTVREGRVTSVVDATTGAPRPVNFRQPIDSLFAIVRTELLERPELLTMTFDSRLGFPTRLSFGEQALDGGAVITVEQLVAIP